MFVLLGCSAAPRPGSSRARCTWRDRHSQLRSGPRESSGQVAHLSCQQEQNEDRHTHSMFHFEPGQRSPDRSRHWLADKFRRKGLSLFEAPPAHGREGEGERGRREDLHLESNRNETCDSLQIQNCGAWVMFVTCTVLRSIGERGLSHVATVPWHHVHGRGHCPVGGRRRMFFDVAVVAARHRRLRLSEEESGPTRRRF